MSLRPPRTLSPAPVPEQVHADFPARPRPLARATAKSRDDEQLSIALLVQRAYRGESHEDISAGTGASRPTVTRWGLAHEPHAPSLTHLYRGLRNPKSAAWCRRLLDALDDLRRNRGNGLPDGTQQALVTQELTDVLRRFADAMTDGQVAGPEVVDVLREVDEARDALTVFAAELRARLREVG